MNNIVNINQQELDNLPYCSQRVFKNGYTVSVVAQENFGLFSVAVCGPDLALIPFEGEEVLYDQDFEDVARIMKKVKKGKLD